MKNLLLVVLLIGLFSCEKNSGDNNFKPSKITRITEEGQETSYITYDGADPVTVESDNQLRVFEYQSNKLIKQNVFRKGDEIPWLFLSYDYNHQDEVIKVGFNINVNSTVEKWIGEKINSYRLSAYYGYDYKGDGTMIEYYFDNESKDTTSYSVIDFDADKNIICKTRYRFDSDQYVKSRTNKYQYDDQPHYFRNVNYPAYASIYSIINNITNEEITNYYYSWDSQAGVTVQDSTMTNNSITYEYNENSYPITIVSEDETLKIEY